MAEHLIAHLRDVLRSGQDHVPFQILSDEELAAIDHDHESEFILQPWIEGQPDIDAAVSARFGQRSLFLRGLLEPWSEEATGDATFLPSKQLKFVTDARRLGVGYIMVRATYDGNRTGRYVVLQSELGGYEEDIDDDGIHVYAACSYRSALERLADFALPIPDHHGVEVRARIAADRWQPWLLNELGVDTRPVQVNLFLPAASGALEPEAWLVAHANEIGLLATRVGDDLQIASMTPSRLYDRLAERVSIALGVDI